MVTKLLCSEDLVIMSIQSILKYLSIVASNDNSVKICKRLVQILCCFGSVGINLINRNSE